MHSSAFVLREETVSEEGEKKQYSPKEGSTCPHCGKNRVFRSHRKNLLEKLRSRFGHYPFRCRACGHRFFKVIERHTH